MKYICELCGWVYDESKGDPHSKVEPGTRFEDLPEDYECPYCYSGKEAFYQIDDGYRKELLCQKPEHVTLFA